MIRLATQPAACVAQAAGETVFEVFEMVAACISSSYHSPDQPVSDPGPFAGGARTVVWRPI
jgi:hypothetical protein